MRLRVYYGNLNLRQFRKYIKRSLKRNIDFMSSLLLLLECRLDMVLYRANIFKTPFEAKRYIKKGFITINNTKVKNANHSLYLNDSISILEKEKEHNHNRLLKSLKNKSFLSNYPRYLEVNYNILRIIVIFYPKLKDIPLSFKKDLKILRKFF